MPLGLCVATVTFPSTAQLPAELVLHQRSCSQARRVATPWDTAGVRVVLHLTDRSSKFKQGGWGRERDKRDREREKEGEGEGGRAKTEKEGTEASCTDSLTRAGQRSCKPYLGVLVA